MVVTRDGEGVKNEQVSKLVNEYSSGTKFLID